MGSISDTDYTISIHRSVIPLFLSIVGILYNTAIINFENTGIPLFWVSLILLLFPRIFTERSKLVTIVMLLFSILTVLLISHVTLGLGSIRTEVSQYISRSMLLIWFLLVLLYINIYTNKDKFVKYTLILLKLAILYGFYEFAAKNANWPLPFRGLANNTSFTIVDNLEGWIKGPRIRSFWSEPSFTSWPIIIFVYLNWKYKKTNWAFIWHIMAGLFAVLTFSRTTILFYVLSSLLIIIKFLLSHVKYGRQRIGKFLINKTLIPWLVVILIASIFAFSWIFISNQIFSDISSSDRVGSIIIGYQIWLDYPILGSGFNTFHLFDENYRHLVPSYVDERTSLSEMSAILQQAGILGFLILLVTITTVITTRWIKNYDRFFIVFVIITYCFIAPGVLYFGIFWFYLALVLSNDSC